METTSGGPVALIIIIVMMGAFALTTDNTWIRLGALAGAALAVAAILRGRKHD